MKYKSNFKFQIIYGLIGFLTALGIIYLVVKQIDWITSLAVGITNFLVAGFYTAGKCK
jgi:1,4-dihydroxy-2-naphthoate octaprenyltransferase